MKMRDWQEMEVDIAGEDGSDGGGEGASELSELSPLEDDKDGGVDEPADSSKTSRQTQTSSQTLIQFIPSVYLCRSPVCLLRPACSAQTSS